MVLFNLIDFNNRFTHSRFDKIMKSYGRMKTLLSLLELYRIGKTKVT